MLPPVQPFRAIDTPQDIVTEPSSGIQHSIIPAAATASLASIIYQLPKTDKDERR